MNGNKKKTEQIEKIAPIPLFFYFLYFNPFQFLHVKNILCNRIRQLLLLYFLLNLKTKEFRYYFFYFEFQFRILGRNLLDLSRNDSYNFIITPMETDAFQTPFGIFGRNLTGRFPFHDAVRIHGHCDCVGKNGR